MSIETVNQFLTKVSQDEKLQTELSQAVKEQESATAAVELADQHGYKFTPEEFEQQIQKMQKAQDGELSEEELETVAGGLAPLAVAALGSLLGGIGTHLATK